MLEEIKQLWQVIETNGKEQDGAVSISFGDLFEVSRTHMQCRRTHHSERDILLKIYTNISDKLVSTLLKARKKGYVAFEGEMLLQNRDEHVLIRLVSAP